MKPLEARKNSAAARGGGETEPSTGEPEIVGFTLAAYPDTGPVEKNSETRSAGDAIGPERLGSNLGTSRESYKLQPEKIDSEHGWGKAEETFEGHSAGEKR